MAITTICKGCGLEFTGKDEHDLVTQVQAHIAAVHAAGHSPSREQVRAVIRARAVRKEQAASEPRRSG